MAGGAVVGALRVVIGADTAALDKGLKQSQSQLESFGKIAKVSLGALGIAATLEGVNKTIRSTIDQFDEIGKSAQKVGIPVEELSKLKFAAELSDVSFESLTKSLGKFDQQIIKAAGGVDNDFSRALDAMGIKAKDANGNIKSQIQLLGEIADKFATYQDGVAKSALALNLLGKRGAELIPLLNQGSAGFKQAGDDVQRFGTIVALASAQAAEKFNDNMKRLAESQKGIWFQITAGVLPALANISEAFVNTAKTTEIFKTIGEGIGVVLQALATKVQITIAFFGQLIDVVVTTFTVLKNVATGNLTGAGQAITDFTEGAKARFAGLQERIEGIWGAFTPKFSLADVAKAVQGQVEAPVVKSADAAKNAWERFIESQKKALVSQQAQVAGFGQLAGAISATRIQMLGLTAAQEAGFSTLTPAMQKTLDLLKAQSAGTENTLQGLQIKQEVQTSWETYNKTLERNNELLAQGAISQETFSRSNQKAAENIGITWQQQAASISGSFAEIANSFGKENSAIVKTAQVLGAVQALISTYTAQAEALKLPFPLNLAAVAAIAAKGFALVAAIRSTSVPKFAQGGSFQVPGGTAANDNMLLPIALASGERVDVTPAGGAGSAGGNNITIDLRGDQSFFSRATVERMVDAIHTLTEDGHTARIVVLK